jgi:hypothetical protein
LHHYLTWCIHNLKKKKPPVITGPTLGIHPGCCWLNQNVKSLLINFWLKAFSTSSGGYCSFFHTSLTNIYDVGSKFTAAVTVDTFKADKKIYGGICHFTPLPATGM